MSLPPFDGYRRQHFLYEELYNKTRKNLLSLLEGLNEDIKLAKSSRSTSSIHHFLYLELFWIWMLDYTAGVPVEELSPRLADIVDAFELWNDADQIYQKDCIVKFPEFAPYEYHGAPEFPILSDYEDTLQLLSIAILLRDQKSVARIIHVLRNHRGLDGLFEQLISSYVHDAMDIDSCILGEPYDILLNVFYEENENSTLDLVEKYLKYWYPAMRDHPRWHNGHLRIRDEGHAPYYGYWAFEAGAAVFLLDLDDSDMEHLVYPKDLVEYAKKLRSEGRYTSIVDVNGVESGRIADDRLP